MARRNRNHPPWLLEVIGVIVLIIVGTILVKSLVILKDGADQSQPIVVVSNKYLGLTPDIPWDIIYRKAKVKQLKGETRCREYLERVFQRPFPKIRPDWLKNPRTSRNLEIDCYNPQLKLGLEYDGIQHRQYHPFFHRKMSDFTEQMWRDQFKNFQCKRQGVTLIRVPDTVTYNKIEAFIEGELRKVGMLV